ncbi:MAG: HD domain-containing protein [Candidatus Hydrogenedentes bacterium]|nr:HD domain-containing protein [Candidatus Hydrogenedentota bacterium]
MTQEKLIALSGPLSGRVFQLQGAVTIGRNPDNTVQLEDLQVSRRHAKVEQTDRGTILRDLGSGNGTYVGNRRILEYRLSHGDVIRIGDQEFRYEGRVTRDADEPKGETGVRFESSPNKVVSASQADHLFQTFFHPPREVPTQEQLREAQQRLQAVYAANQVITSERDLHRVFAVIMEQIFRLVPAHNGVILLRDRDTGELVTEHVKTGRASTEIVISSSIVQRAAERGEAVITHDAADDSRFEAGMSIIAQNISSAMCAPLKHQEETLGVIYVDTRGTTNAFVPSDLQLLVALAGPAASAIKNAQYVRMLEKSYADTLVVLAGTIEMRDKYTVGHTWRVTNFAVAIARELAWTEDKIRECEMGGVLHDIGKIAIEDAILRKPGKLTDEEFAKIKVHPERGARLLQDVERLHPLIPYCLYHHERYDGHGYPYGLSGEEIPLEGRVIAVADTFDALTSSRPYRKGLSTEIALGEIEKGRGTQFDPAIVDAFLRAFRAGKINRILQDYLKKDEKSIVCPFCSTYIQVPEGAHAGDRFDCGVCHRHICLREQNGAYYGELMPQSSAALQPHLHA